MIRFFRWPASVNESLNSMSCIEYFVTSDPSSTITFNILDIDVNFSDHLPIMAVLACNLLNNTTERKSQASFDPCATNLRWSHANVDLYYQHTLVLLQLVLHLSLIHI